MYPFLKTTCSSLKRPVVDPYYFLFLQQHASTKIIKPSTKNPVIPNMYDLYFQKVDYPLSGSGIGSLPPPCFGMLIGLKFKTFAGCESAMAVGTGPFTGAGMVMGYSMPPAERVE